MVDILYISGTNAKLDKLAPAIEAMRTLGLHFIVAPNVRTALGLLQGRTPGLICCTTQQIPRLQRTAWPAMRKTPVVALGEWNRFLHLSPEHMKGIKANITPTVQHNPEALRHALICLLQENNLMPQQQIAAPDTPTALRSQPVPAHTLT